MMISLPRMWIALSFGQRLRVCGGDRCRAGRNATLKGLDAGKSRMRGGYAKRRSFRMFVFPLLA